MTLTQNVGCKIGSFIMLFIVRIIRNKQLKKYKNIAKNKVGGFGTAHICIDAVINVTVASL